MTGWDDAPVFAHLRALTDEHGVFEHARFDAPRRDHGYCVDDVARALIVVVRESELSPQLAHLEDMYLSFVDRAVVADGTSHNRMSMSGAWTDQPGSGDWWGRALWALGTTAAHATTTAVRERALTAFSRAASARSLDLRAMAFAAVGAAEVLDKRPTDRHARALLHDAAAAIPVPADPQWPWPEPRLRYANAAIPEALLAAGAGLHQPALIEAGLRMLRFLLDIETVDGHLSITGVDGRGPAERGVVQFDQQPIEVAAIADACARAFAVTGDDSWRHPVGQAWAWFTGDNDVDTVMVDLDTGAGYDGLTPNGRNENRGAESTLAVLSTYQQARRLGVVHTVPA